MIVRWGLHELERLLFELGISRPLLVTSERFGDLELPVATRFSGVRRHAPVETVSAAVAAARDSDGLVGVGGGSAIDTGKAVSAALGLGLVAVPTTYAGAEWTSCASACWLRASNTMRPRRRLRASLCWRF